MGKRLHQISHIVNILAIVTIVHIVIEIGFSSVLGRRPLALHLLDLFGGRALFIPIDFVVIE